MIRRAYCFECDWCGVYECFLGENEPEAKHEARLENWRMSGAHGCYCSGECYADAKQDAMAMKEQEKRDEKSLEAFNV